MNPLHHILVAVDFSTGSLSALKQAARLARVRDARLHVLHVVDSMAVALMAQSLQESYDDRAAVASEGAAQALQRWLHQAETEVDGKVIVSVGTPFTEILDHLEKLNADLLVAGITGAGNSTTGAGAIASKLARKARVPVLLVRSDHPELFHKIVAGIDFSESAPEVAACAHQIAEQDGARVDFVHVWHEPWVAMPYFAVPLADSGVPVATFTPEQRESYLQGLRRELHAFVKDAGGAIGGGEILIEAASGGKGLAGYARESAADLIIVGDKGRTLLHDVLLGSTAERLLTLSHCSLLVVKGTGK